MSDWNFDLEAAPLQEWVLAWLYLPKNPIASSWVKAQRCYVEREDPENYEPHERLTFGCWWANNRYYSAGHVQAWMPPPNPPSLVPKGGPSE